MRELVTLDKPLVFWGNSKRYEITSAVLTPHGVQICVTWGHDSGGRTSIPVEVVLRCLADNTWIWEETQ